MRFTKNIDIPDELIRAQEEDKLVIFAGAGVCMSPPTNLPGFKELIKEVENKYGMERKDREEYDKYLGRVKRDGKPVEDFIRTRFSGSALLHNQLHVGVISLFRQDGPTRIITTNFDVLFSNALDSLHREKVHHYHAPALPPGNRFEGIVHLHGCAAETISELVFTDDDFGRAYLREGWAREFLTGVFSQFKVLFIGYSIEDPFVRYFVRGLTPESRIYAFVHRGKVPDWRDLGAMPISGDILQKSDFYEEQQESIVEWGQHCNMSISEHERKIKQLTSLLLPHDRVNSDYIIACLKDLARTRLFARYVTDKDWLAWLDKKQVLDNLFANRSELSAIDSVLAEWISKEFVRQHTAEVIDVILDHNMSLNPDFWRIIVENLSRDEDKLEPKELAKWVQVLLRDGRVPKFVEIV